MFVGSKYKKHSKNVADPKVILKVLFYEFSTCLNSFIPGNCVQEINFP